MSSAVKLAKDVDLKNRCHSSQRAEYERLQSETSELAIQLAQAIAEREAQGSLAKDNTQKLNQSLHENGLLQKQLGDLGHQIQSLLREIGRLDDSTLLHMTEDVHAHSGGGYHSLVTVLFKSISGLQAQNQKLLQIRRSTGTRWREKSEAIREAHEAMQELAAWLESQKKNSESIIQSYVKERNTLETMRRRRRVTRSLASVDGGSAAASVERQSDLVKELAEVQSHFDANTYYMLERANLSGDSLFVDELAHLSQESGRTSRKGQGTAQLWKSEPWQTSRERLSLSLDPTRVLVWQSDLVKELAEVQSQFDTYRTEMGVDSREGAHLGAALAKANARIEYLTDRHRMHQEKFAFYPRQVDDLTKRNQKLFDQWIRIDIECSRATEELQIATGQIEQLRNESANLRAEKKIWEVRYSNRLIQFSVSTLDLGVQSRLVGENKTLALERGHLSDLVSNVQKMHNDLERAGENDRRSLESQQELRAQLVQERDTIRHINLQKEIKLKELQSHLDRNVQGSEEKLSVYKRRPVADHGISNNIGQDMSREQQLETEVAELRSAFKVAEFDLATSRGHVEQFKEISQASEVALNNLNSTYEDCKMSTGAVIARHEAEYAALQERLQLAQEELTQLKGRQDELQKALDAEHAAWVSDKKTLEDTIVDLSTSERNTETDRSSREDDIRQLEERAKATEACYSNEVVSHADSIKSIKKLKHDLTVSLSLKRPRPSLRHLKTGWGNREALDKEIADLDARQAADSSAAAQAEGDAPADSDTKLIELRQVVQYLRKEKEIVDLRLEVGKQENARLKGQSNATLRADCEKHAKCTRELEAKLKRVSAELEPVKEKSHTSQAEPEASEAHVVCLEEENRRWQERNAGDAERDSAVALAVEKAKAKFEMAGTVNSSEESKRHEEELHAMRATQALARHHQAQDRVVALKGGDFRDVNIMERAKESLREHHSHISGATPSLHFSASSSMSGQPAGALVPFPKLHSVQTTPHCLHWTRYLALHAACTKVAFMSGTAEHIDMVMRDIEDIKVLAADGSSAKVLAHALQTCAANA
ncbi:hypothetical protein F5887DRAFT_919553 [Amanita rubescens]|nr:hypothetical protein F5887DRAFT_919553 [Amanita rubescens]